MRWGGGWARVRDVPYVHRLSEVDPETRMGTCANCGRVRVKPRSTGGWKCKVAEKKWQQPRPGNRWGNTRYPVHRGSPTRRALALTAEWWERTLLEYPTCAACDVPWSSTEPPCIDHDHETGEIRGLLCRACNGSLGPRTEEQVRASLAVAEVRAERWRRLLAYVVNPPLRP